MHIYFVYTVFSKSVYFRNQPSLCKRKNKLSGVHDSSACLACFRFSKDGSFRQGLWKRMAHNMAVCGSSNSETHCHPYTHDALSHFVPGAERNTPAGSRISYGGPSLVKVEYKSVFGISPSTVPPIALSLLQAKSCTKMPRKRETRCRFPSWAGVCFLR